MSRRPNRKKLREAKQRAWVESVKKEAAKRPPVVKYVPAPPPVESVLSIIEDLRSGHDDDFVMNVQELNVRPAHRVMARCVAPTGAMRAHMMREGIAGVERTLSVRTERFQAMQMGLRVDGTQFVWWTWMPCREALKPEVSYGLRRAQAYGEQIKSALASGWITVHGRGVGMEGALADFRKWVDLVLEDCAQNLGQP